MDLKVSGNEAGTQRYIFNVKFRNSFICHCTLLNHKFSLPGCFVSPPYLDEYGETDQGLKRGNPLHLDATQYSRLHAMWLSHSIPDIIAHTVESNSGVVPTEWQHL